MASYYDIRKLIADLDELSRKIKCLNKDISIIQKHINDESPISYFEGSSPELRFYTSEIIVNRLVK